MTPAIEQGKLNQLVGQILNDLGGAASVAMVRMGDALGLYKTLHEKGSMTSEELAKAAGAHERYVREWLAHQAASNYLTYDQTNGKFTLPPEQAMLFAIEDSPVTMLGAFDGVAAWAEGQPKVQAAFRHGGGVKWGDMAPCLFCAVARFFRPGYLQNLVQNWLPTLDGVEAKLRDGARVADVGCGHGWSTVIMAQAFPQSQFFGFDFHPGSIEQAQAHAREHNVSNVHFQVGTAKDYRGTRFGPRDVLRLPARHGRSRRCRCPCEADIEAEWHMDDRRADGRRQAGRQHEPDRPHLLRRLHARLRSNVAVARGRRGIGRAGRRSETPRSHHGRRLPQRAAGD